LLKIVDQNLEVLFVKRVENPTDPWSGQMALPGGKRIPEDENLMRTVVRETLEETSINILKGCRFLGVMDIVRSIARPEMKVLPFVILLEREQPVGLCKAELEWSAWIPLEELVKHGGTVSFSFGEFPAYIVGKNVVWGLTYRIIENLFHALREL
jgi:8-oxo-dGTP pyrophosphatase MutT (NUDIX family)